MSESIPGPISGLIGPGSQPGEEDGATLDIFPMPSGMTTFSTPDLPEPEDANGLEAGIATLDAVLEQLKASDGGKGASVDLSGLDAANLDLVNQVLGEGEVAIIAGTRYQAQEAVLAGVWRVRETDEGGEVISDTVEVGAFPRAIAATAFAGAKSELSLPEELGPNVFNAPPLVTEINEQLAHRGNGNGSGPHVINLSLLPHTEEDLTFLDALLGRSGLTVLSRGYGNCRIMATATRDTWWVQYYNSQDAMILNSIEIGGVPEVACAAPEDIADSAERLHEILEIYR
ncbi:MAG: hydrogenase expression/formation protein [Novosphingobium sp.]|nr:hydrogenase expression/formation protein [Novosphingobium sp.]